MKKFALLMLSLAIVFSASLSYAEEVAVEAVTTAVNEVQQAVNQETQATVPMTVAPEAPQMPEIVTEQALEVPVEAPDVPEPPMDVAPVSPEAEAVVPDEVAAPVENGNMVETPASENLEFISGEITALADTEKSITVKLYGEAEANAADKLLTIKLDENTDLTDGEKDRDFKSLAVGTEVDVEYDPASNKATYIFVY